MDDESTMNAMIYKNQQYDLDMIPVSTYLTRRVPPSAIQGYRVFTVARFLRYLPRRVPSSVIQMYRVSDSTGRCRLVTDSYCSITDEIRQNENNGNNVNRRNGRRGPGNDGDAQPTDIHVWLERFRKEKP
ncbi:hypothetical protein Tco_0710273 [Tanacetum coccineum]